MHLFLLTLLCLTLFASNTILCRAALISFSVEPFTYTAIRALSASLMLTLVGTWVQKRRKTQGGKLLRQLAVHGSWKGAVFLYGYMLCFSLAFINIPSGSGTLIINFSVQVAMLGWGLLLGVRMSRQQFLALGIALSGLILLVSEHVSVPSPVHGVLISISGLCWGGYTLVGKESLEPVLATAGNFLRTVPFALVTLLLAVCLENAGTPAGILCAVVAGTLATALGYCLWYEILPKYDLMTSSIIQLAVPIITTILAFIFLREGISLQFILSAFLILFGISLEIYYAHKNAKAVNTRDDEG